MTLENYKVTVDDANLKFEKKEGYYVMYYNDRPFSFIYPVDLKVIDNKSRQGYRKAAIERKLKLYNVDKETIELILKKMEEDGILLIDNTDYYHPNEDRLKRFLSKGKYILNYITMNGDEWSLITELDTNKILLYHKGSSIDFIPLFTRGEFNQGGLIFMVGEASKNYDLPVFASTHFLKSMETDGYEEMKINK